MRIRIGEKILILFDIVDLKRTVMGLQSNSFTENGCLNSVFLDYDSLSLDEIDKDIVRLQTKYDLPTFYLYRSSKKDNGEVRHNAFCFTPLKFDEWIEILWSSKEDYHHKMIAQAEKRATLRFTSKGGLKGLPKLEKVYKRTSKTREELGNGFFILDKLLKAEEESIRRRSGG